MRPTITWENLGKITLIFIRLISDFFFHKSPCNQKRNRKKEKNHGQHAWNRNSKKIKSIFELSSLFKGLRPAFLFSSRLYLASDSYKRLLWKKKKIILHHILKKNIFWKCSSYLVNRLEQVSSQNIARFLKFLLNFSLPYSSQNITRILTYFY